MIFQSYNQNYRVSSRDWYYNRADWQEAFSVLPRRCDISNRWIWGRHYLGIVTITGPGEPVTYHLWNHRDEHLIYKLTGKVK